MKSKSAFLTAAAAVPVLALVFWLSGCDFTHVDEPAHVPIKQVLTSLEEADSEAEMEEAVERLLGKLAIGTPEREGPYSDYELSDAKIAELARAQLQYKAGALKDGFTFGGVHDLLVELDADVRTVDSFTPLERPEMNVSMEYALDVLKASTAAALKSADAPSSALLVSLAADGADIPQQAPVFSVDTEISPVQRFLFGVWLHYYAPALSDAESIEIAGKGGGGRHHGGGFSNECPYGYELVDKFEAVEGNPPKMVWEKGIRDSSTVVISNIKDKEGTEVASFDWLSEVYYIDLVQVKAGTKVIKELIPGRTSGTVTNDDLYNKGISNVLFCKVKTQKGCWYQAYKQLVACKCAADSHDDKKECWAEFLEDLHACQHPQGMIY